MLVYTATFLQSSSRLHDVETLHILSDKRDVIARISPALLSPLFDSEDDRRWGRRKVSHRQSFSRL